MSDLQLWLINFQALIFDKIQYSNPLWSVNFDRDSFKLHKVLQYNNWTYNQSKTEYFGHLIGQKSILKMNRKIGKNSKFLSSKFIGSESFQNHSNVPDRYDQTKKAIENYKSQTRIRNHLITFLTSSSGQLIFYALFLDKLQHSNPLKVSILIEISSNCIK